MKKLLFLIVFIISLFVISCGSSGEVQKPTLSMVLNAGVDTVEVYTSYQDPGAVAYYGTNLVATTKTSNVDVTKVGSYEVTYKATYNGETISKVRKVEVVDTVAPEATINAGVDTIFVGDKWNDAGVFASDNSRLDPTVVVSGSVDTNTAGEYIITYTVKDSSNNETIVKRYVNVLEK